MPLSLDDQNIRKPIETMKKQYDMASKVISQASIRDLLDERSLEDHVKDICNFYDTMTGIWTSGGKDSPAYRKSTCHASLKSGPRFQQDGADTTGVVAAAMSSKRKLDAISDAMSTLGALTFEKKKADNLKRRKLDMVNQRLALDVHVLNTKLELMDARIIVKTI
ncbi:hypothetical protein BGX21_003900 [Mortierella sp. AD011]|nr:hypothetical protein BGX20_006142 [Mortierella sp. AD010]KAF9404012.1 hypothetical protein BGX21_003900 [Mortierella sp. AD011]